MSKNNPNPLAEQSRNLENVHIKRIDRAIAAMERMAELHLGGECEQEMKACAKELGHTRGILLLLFDKIDEAAD